MYNSNALLPAHGRLRLDIIFTRKNGERFVEVGYAQSVNVSNHIDQMIEEATLNAFYKLNNRLGERVFNKNNYAEDLSKYLKSIEIIHYDISYFEDRIYSYKQESVNGRRVYVISRHGEEYQRVNNNTLSKEDLQNKSDKLV